MKRQKTLVDKEIEPEKTQYWMNKIIDFLTQSNEKWILDQFNLCKRFFLQNSIEGKTDDFHYIHIMNLKNKPPRVEENLKRVLNTSIHNKLEEGFKRVSNTDRSLVKIEEPESEIPSKVENPAHLNDNKVMKCDIAALLKAIEEIEKRVKMEKILLKVS